MKIRQGETQKRQDAGARKSTKVAKHGVFPMSCGSGRSKSTFAKSAGAEPAGQIKNEQVHAGVAKHMWKSQCTKHTRVHFWKLRYRKNACGCSPKHIWKSKCTKHTRVGALVEVEMSQNARGCSAKRLWKSKCTKHTKVGALLEVEMSKKCMRLRPQAPLEVKMYKTHEGRSISRS